jgi:hypothetical protein
MGPPSTQARAMAASTGCRWAELRRNTAGGTRQIDRAPPAVPSPGTRERAACSQRPVRPATPRHRGKTGRSAGTGAPPARPGCLGRADGRFTDAPVATSLVAGRWYGAAGCHRHRCRTCSQARADAASTRDDCRAGHSHKRRQRGNWALLAFDIKNIGRHLVTVSNPHVEPGTGVTVLDVRVEPAASRFL